MSNFSWDKNELYDKVLRSTKQVFEYQRKRTWDIDVELFLQAGYRALEKQIGTLSFLLGLFC
jgi:hypothetical protein